MNCSPMKEILVLSSDFKPMPGGIAELAYQICKELSNRGYRIDVITHKFKDCLEEESLNGIFIHRIYDEMTSSPNQSRLKTILNNYFWMKKVRGKINRFIRAAKPEILFCTNYHKLFADILKTNKLPFLLYMHGEDVTAIVKTKNPLNKKRLQFLTERAKRIFFNSRYSMNLLEKFTDNSQNSFSVTGCGFPIDQIINDDLKAASRQKLGLNDEKILLTTSRLVIRKGIDTVLHAMPIIMKKFSNIKYLVVGDGPDKEKLIDLSKKLGIDNKVRFCGFVSEEIKKDCYLASDVYVMPSKFGDLGEVEGFGISFLEANAHGLPVIGSNVGGITDAVENGKNGFLVDPDDPNQLAEKVINLLNDPLRCQQMAESGKERIRKQFNWVKIVDDIEKNFN